MATNQDPRIARLKKGLEAADAEEAQLAEEQEQQLRLAMGRTTKALAEADLNPEQLEAVRQFIQSGAAMPRTDENLRKRLEETEEKLREFRGKKALVFDSDDECKNAKRILDLFRNGGGKLQPSDAVDNMLKRLDQLERQERDRKESQRETQGPPERAGQRTADQVNEKATVRSATYPPENGMPASPPTTAVKSPPEHSPTSPEQPAQRKGWLRKMYDRATANPDC